MISANLHDTTVTTVERKHIQTNFEILGIQRVALSGKMVLIALIVIGIGAAVIGGAVSAHLFGCHVSKTTPYIYISLPYSL